MSLHICECLFAEEPRSWALCFNALYLSQQQSMKFERCGAPAFESIKTSKYGQIWVCDRCHVRVRKYGKKVTSTWDCTEEGSCRGCFIYDE
jgi:hypothetical protein